MKPFSDKQHNGAIAAIVIVAIVIVLWLYMRSKPRQRSGSCPICDYLAGLSSSPAGTTNPGILNGTGPTGAPNLAFQTLNYTVPIPSFHYSGNSQIYMPLFGFVGYSSIGTIS